MPVFPTILYMSAGFKVDTLMFVSLWNSKEATEICTSLLTRQRVFLLPIVIKIVLLCIEDTILTDILTNLIVLSSFIGCCPVTLMAPYDGGSNFFLVLFVTLFVGCLPLCPSKNLLDSRTCVTPYL